MEYSDFKLEQLMSSSRHYSEICELLFGLAPDEKTKTVLEDILYKGGYEGYGVSSKICNKDNPSIEITRRISIAHLLITNPETFTVLVDEKIDLFHGTNANALPNILKYGLNSANESQKRGVTVTTGEAWSRPNNERDFISFTDVLEVAQGYATIKPDASSTDYSFEVVIGTSSDDIRELARNIYSDIPEVGVKSNLSLEKIRMIGVPSSKVEFVKKLLPRDDIKVLPMDGFDRKFYYVDDIGIIYISIEEYEKLKSDSARKSKKEGFTLEEIKKLTLGRLLSNMKKQAERFKTIIIGDKDVDYDGKKL